MGRRFDGRRRLRVTARTPSVHSRTGAHTAVVGPRAIPTWRRQFFRSPSPDVTVRATAISAADGRPATAMLRLLRLAYRRGVLPQRGSSRLFDKTPTWLWGGEAVDIETFAGPMTVPLRDHGPRQLLLFGELRHERAETALLARLAPHLTNVLDLGANVGWYSCVLATAGLPSHARVLAVDPNPTTAPYLAANARRYPQVDALFEAVGEEIGEATFYCAHSSDLSSVSRPVGTPTTVPLITVDHLVASRFESSVDLVKCDVEGGEMAVLRGARSVRSAPRPPIWLLEAYEGFLNASGCSYEALEEELGSIGEHVTKFVADGEGFVELPRLADLRQRLRSNVLLVPESRIPTVAAALAG